MRPWLTGVACVLLSGCGSPDDGLSSIVEIEKSAPSCASGGITVVTGIDKSGNGSLEPGEETSREEICNGADGATGPTGDAGLDGKDGRDGLDNRILTSAMCYGTISGTGLEATYQVVEMSTGDKLARGSISGLSSSVSNVAFCSVLSVGNADCPVFLVLDAAGASNAGWWKLSLDLENNASIVENHDADLPGGVQSWVMPATYCQRVDY